MTSVRPDRTPAALAAAAALCCLTPRAPVAQAPPAQAPPAQAPSAADAAGPPAAPAAGGPAADRPRDWDFLVGRWTVRHRRLKARLAGGGRGGGAWDEFAGTTVARLTLGGFGNMDDNVLDAPGGRYHAVTVRAFDRAAEQWLIWWVDTRYLGTPIDPPMRGAFRDGVGTFFGDGTHDGRPIRVRFLWSRITPSSARWEQAFSADGGATWETNWIMDFTRAAAGAAPSAEARDDAARACCAVVELRRYTLKPGTRDAFVALFDREFVETQEAAGMRLVAQFRDLDRPDVFTWIRGFPDMPSRAASLGAFYGGPVWAAHRTAANGMIEDSDDVRLLRPAAPGAGVVPDGPRPAPGAPNAAAAPRGLVVATVYTVREGDAPRFARFFADTVAPRLAAAGARPVGAFETEPSANTFPRLPVRAGERAFVWLARFADAAAHDRAVAALAADARWAGEVRPALERRLRVPAEVWRLEPTARSHVPR